MRPLALLCLAVPTLSLAAPAVSARSRIEAVTVYRSSARVVRTAAVDLARGAGRIAFAALPDRLDDDSLRVEGRGSARGRLFGVSIERVTGAEAAAADARSAEERLQRLQDEDRALEDRLKAAHARAKLVESLRSTYAEERAKNLALREVSTKEWRDVAAFVEGELAGVSAEVRRLEGERRALGRRIVQARAELDRLQAKRAQTTKTVTVEVDAEQAGTFEVTLSYAVAEAGWEAIWDARLAPDAGTMELTFLGAVWQRTGEDWTDVALSLSTAQPGRGLYVPQLEPRYLARAEPVRPWIAEKRSRARAEPAAPAAAPAEGLEQREATADMELAEATVERGLLSATFTAARRETVDGSGQSRKVSLARFPLRAEIVRTAAPRLEAAAFLTAKAVNETGFPILAGRAAVYVGDELAGRAAIPATPPGGELELAFGADDRVEIERKVLERRRESAGLVSKQDVYRYRVLIAVKNRWATPVAVRLLDLVPVSRDEKIEVELLPGTTAATREDPERPGVRAWELALGPREEKAVELRYEIRFPRGFPVAGLE
jgi:uncharacterized protein (TIGR02231 family)